MTFTALPPSAAWLHQDARSGFEVAYFRRLEDGHLINGCTTAIEEGRAWVVNYEIRVSAGWRTRSARVTGRSSDGSRSLRLDSDGEGRWRANRRRAPRLDGCLDVDLESSAMTNALPVHRLGLALGQGAAAPAAYVRTLDLRVERLDQQYHRIGSPGSQQRYDYAAPAFDFTCELLYDEDGLVLAYPGIAVRAG